MRLGDEQQPRRVVKRQQYPTVTWDAGGNIYFRGLITPRSAFDFQKALSESEQNPGVEIINLHLSTDGGHAQSSLFMYDLMRTTHKGIICTIDEYACSGGSIVLCGADMVLAYESSVIMIHDNQLIINGQFSHTDMTKTVEYGEILNNRVLQIYNEKTSRTGFKIEKKMIEKNWWITAQYGRQIGLIDEIIPALPRPQLQLDEQDKKPKKKK